MFSSLVSSLRARVLFSFFVLFVAVPLLGATTRTLVIARVYGGSTTTSYSPSDYVELFNGSPTTINLKYFTLQQQSGTSTSGFGSTSRIQLPDFNLRPGQYFLIQMKTQTNPTPFPLAPDFVTTTDYSSGDGKVAIVYGSSLLPACAQTGVSVAPPPVSDNLVDFVGYGGNCASNSDAAPTTASNRALYRKDVCNDTNDDGVDFATESNASLVPKHNSQTPLTPCYASGDGPALNASYSPATVYATQSLYVYAAVTPATNPPSNSLRVNADFSALGSSANGVLYDDGTHGDATAGDNIYTYRITVPAGQAAGNISIPVTLADDTFRVTGQTLTVNVGGPLPTTTPIHSIQAAVPSSYAGQSVSVEGIVTAVTSNGFYLQAADANADADPNTSEAIFASAATVPPDAVAGNDIIVTGTVQSSMVNTLGGTLSVIKIGTGSLPTLTTIAATDADSTSSPFNLRKYEAMRVKLQTATLVSPEDGTLAADGSVTGKGSAWAVIGTTARPFREAGAPASAALPSGAPATVTRWDENLERIQLTGNIFGSNLLANATAQQTLSSAFGILEFASGKPNVLLTSVTSAGTPLSEPTALNASGDSFFGVASINLENLYNATADGGEPVVLSSANFATRLGKASAQVRDLLAAPDVVAVQGVENLATLQALAARISTDASAAGEADPAYQVYLQSGTDSTKLNTGYLVRTVRASVSSVAQEAGSTTYFSPLTNSMQNAFTSPPLVMKLGVKQNGGGTYPLTLINVNLLGADGVEDTTTAGQDVRAHREAQAEAVAQLVQNHQAAGEHVAVLGEFHAFQFSDGYVDVTGAIAGTPVDASLVVTPSPANIVASPLVNLSAGVAAGAPYSSIANGNAETTEQFLVSSSLAGGSSASFLHANADYPATALTNSATAARSSSRDAVLAYLAVPNLQRAVDATLSISSYDFGSLPANSTLTKDVLLTNAGTSPLNLTSIAISGAGFTQTNTCGVTVAAGQSCTITVQFAPTAAQNYSATLSITDNAPGSPQQVSFTGSGLMTTATASPTSINFGDIVVSGVAGNKTVTVTNTGSATLSISSASIGSWPGTVSNGCSGNVAPQGTCVVTVTYSPVANGASTGTLTLAGDMATPLTITLSGNGVPPVPKVVFNPTVLSFGDQTVGFASSALSVTLSNPGTGPAAISSIVVSGDFSQTNNCPASLAINASCTMQVKFTPTVTGNRTGAISVTDNAAGSPHTLSLSGNGIPAVPIVNVTGGPLSFANTLATQTSSPMSITVSNSGYAPLAFTSIAATANFGIATTGTTCSTSTPVAIGSSCVVAVVFRPTVGGPLSGSLVLTDNATSSPQSVALNGNGIDFSLTAMGGGTSATVKAGDTATYTLSLTPQAYSGLVSFNCSSGTLPTYAACSISPTSTSLVAGTPQTITVKVITYSQTVSSISGRSGIALAGLLFAGLVFLRGKQGRWKGLRLLCALLMIFTLSASLTGCGLSYNKASEDHDNPYKTAPGTYTFSVTGTSTTNGVTLTHTLPLTLTVQ